MGWSFSLLPDSCEFYDGRGDLTDYFVFCSVDWVDFQVNVPNGEKSKNMPTIESSSVTEQDRYIRRLRWSVLAILCVLTVWQLLPWVKHYLIGLTAEPRAIAARGQLAEDEQTTINIFEQASPSVVFISTRQRVRNYWTRNVFSIPKGSGSGFVWDDLGHVVTNNHVIESASEATVRLNDGRSYSAVLVGSSPAHDLAVLRIDVAFDNPPPVPVGTSGDLKVGQKVFAIGNPFGLDYTLTSGLVSALDRALEEENGVKIDHLIQTDAAINPGNSGGPLLDSAGRLIGINTAIYSPSGAYAGIGFAVPVDTVNRVVPDLIAHGKYIRPTLGVEVDADINKAVMRELGLEGVLILKVGPGSAAEVAGLRGTRIDRYGKLIPGDIIKAINGEVVDSVAELFSRLDDYRIGDHLTLSIWRAGQEVDVDILLKGGI